MSLVELVLHKLQESGERAPEVEHWYNGAAQPRLAIDLETLRQAGLVPAEEDERRLMEQYRHIKRPLIANINANGRGATSLLNRHLIVIASAMPGEGKTFTAINLALSMAMEKDVQVVLVDADVAKPQLTQMLRSSEAPGLLDALSDESLDIERVVLATDVPNLALVPAGRRSLQATELLASARMARIASDLVRHDRRRIVLFDSPPLLLTNESQVLTSVAGQIVVVVRAAMTPQPVVLDALELVQGEAPIYLVLNQSLRAPSGAYSYYHSYAQPVAS
jgi:exopolysaccharide/PEP-CTERM locus tyrosine autokinase